MQVAKKGKTWEVGCGPSWQKTVKNTAGINRIEEHRFSARVCGFILPNSIIVIIIIEKIFTDLVPHINKVLLTKIALCVLFYPCKSGLMEFCAHNLYWIASYRALKISRRCFDLEFGKFCLRIWLMAHLMPN